MRTFFITTIIAGILATQISCKRKAQKDTEDNKQKTKTESSAIPRDMENILGEWALDRILRDDNGNHRIDEDEEKTAIANTGYMKLNADGTCKFQTVMDGTYKIVTEEDGRKRIDIQDLAGTKYPMSLYIVSVSKNDLVINTVAGGSGFEIYKRP